VVAVHVADVYILAAVLSGRQVARLGQFKFQSQPITAVVPIRWITNSPGRVHILGVCRKRDETRKVRPRLKEALSGFCVSSPALDES
jgi:hypothetical protein